MQEKIQLNHFSLISRLFGNLFYRQPTDNILSGVFTWLQQHQLSEVWPLTEDAESQQALDALQMPIDLTLLEKEYQKLLGEKGAVATQISAYDISVADFENFRRRTAKEKEELAAVITQNLLTDLLPLLDNFERAMAVEQSDGEAFQKGVEMIFTQLREVMEKHGLEHIEAEGKPFDPNVHQAVMRVENPDVEDGTITQVLQKGYQAKGRVIRPAMVQVAGN